MGEVDPSRQGGVDVESKETLKKRMWNERFVDWTSLKRMPLMVKVRLEYL